MKIDIIHRLSFLRCLLITGFYVEAADVAPFSATLGASHVHTGVILPTSKLATRASHFAPLFNGLFDQSLWLAELDTFLVRRFVNVALAHSRGEIFVAYTACATATMGTPP